MEFKTLFIAATLTTALTACGGGSDSESSPPPPPPPPAGVTFSGKVADGYLVGAKVCVDLNRNKICDSGEPSATTTAGGNFSITDATQEQLNTYPLVVEVTAGTVDEDTGEAITQGYTLSAPAGSGFVSPLTTLMQGEIEQGQSKEEAEAALKAMLGTVVDITKDYVAAKNDAGLSDEQKAEYAQLHHVAQVTARVIAANLAQIQDAATAAGISADDLLALIVDTVVNALETIVAQVEAATEAGDEFDPDVIATSDAIEGATTVSGDNLEEQVKVLNAQANAADANLVTEVSNKGIFWFNGDYHNEGLELEYGQVKYDSASQTTTETSYYLQDGEFVVDDSNEADLDDFILTANGWQQFSDDYGIRALNSDGTLTLGVAGFPQLNEILSATGFELNGLNIKVLLSKHENSWVWHKVMPTSAQFSDGAKAFVIKTTTSAEQYRLFYWDDCNADDKVGGLCNTVWYRKPGGGDAAATSLSALISATGSDGSPANLVGPYVAWHDNSSILAELIAGGSVKYHKLYWAKDEVSGNMTQKAMLYATGTWRQATESGQTLLLMALPDTVKRFSDHEDDGELLLAVLEGAVRRGEHLAAGHTEEDEVVFNETAANDILTSVDLTLANGGNPPQSDFVCSLGDSSWDDNSNSPVPSTLKSLAEYRSLVNECRSSTQAMPFTTEMLVGHQFKEYDSDGTLEVQIVFNESGGYFTDYHEQPAETTEFSWSINDKGELVVEVADGNGGVAMRAHLSLIGKDGDKVSIKGYTEETDWSPMDGSAGEVWSEKWLWLAQAN